MSTSQGPRATTGTPGPDAGGTARTDAGAPGTGTGARRMPGASAGSGAPSGNSPAPATAAGTGTAPTEVGGAARAAAVGLWALVGAGLAYGVVQTVIRAAQLFT